LPDCLAALKGSNNKVVCAHNYKTGYLVYSLEDGRSFPPDFPEGTMAMTRDACFEAVSKSSASHVCSRSGVGAVQLYEVRDPDKPGHGTFDSIGACTKVTEKLSNLARKY
jgi:hypothetical protein